MHIHYRTFEKCSKVGNKRKKNHPHPEITIVNYLAYFIPYFYVYTHIYTSSFNI